MHMLQEINEFLIKSHWEFHDNLSSIFADFFINQNLWTKATFSKLDRFFVFFPDSVEIILLICPVLDFVQF